MVGLGEFVLVFLGKVFVLFENLLDLSYLCIGLFEDNVINMLFVVLMFFFVFLLFELFDMVLEKFVNFVFSYVVY